MDQTAKPSLDQILLDLTTKKQGILRQPVPGSDRVIDDPVAHANACYGGGYRVTEFVDRWRKESEYHTTGELPRSGRSPCFTAARRPLRIFSGAFTGGQETGGWENMMLPISSKW